MTAPRKPPRRVPCVWHICSGSYVDQDPFARESTWRTGKSRGGRPRKPRPESADLAEPQPQPKRRGKR